MVEPAQQMPFGKNKHLAPRAKKKEKVAARSEASNAIHVIYTKGP